MKRSVLAVAALVVGLCFVGAVAQAEYSDPMGYLNDYESYDRQRVLEELHSIHYELDHLYSDVLYYASATVGGDQEALVALELEVAELEARATALLLHAFRLRQWEVDVGLPFGLELEILIVRTKEIYVEIIARCVVIERLFISVVLKWD